MKHKRFLILAFALLLTATNVFSQYLTVKIEKLPTTTDEFIQMRNEIATTPQGGAAMFLVALRVYQTNPTLGEQMLVLAVDKSVLKAGDTYKGYSLLTSDMRLIKEQLNRYPYLFFSYVKGATPQNGYSASLPYVFRMKPNQYSGNPLKGPYKLFVKCSGAATPRPITVKKNNHGIWKATNWNSLLVGIMKPAAEADDEL